MAEGGVAPTGGGGGGAGADAAASAAGSGLGGVGSYAGAIGAALGMFIKADADKYVAEKNSQVAMIQATNVDCYASRPS
jgi:hypothetical protein